MKPPSIPPAAFRGDNGTDPYRWLREKNNPAVIDHLNAENRYTESIMQPAEAPARNCTGKFWGG